jgi:hypothetical protein
MTELWIDIQPLIGGGLLVWCFDQTEYEIKTIML